MDTEKNMNDEVHLRAEKLLYYNELLIEQCDGWLSAEEGNRNMMRQIEEKRKKERATMLLNTINRIAGFFRLFRIK